jgi:signal transduction histidine kinase
MSPIRQFLQRLRLNERWMLMSFLIVAVALPTIFFLFFLRRSLLSETELAQSTTTASFLSSLAQAHEALGNYLADHDALVAPPSEADLAPGERFARAVERGAANSLILLGPEGQPVFPALPLAQPAAKLTERDREALELRQELHSSVDPQTKWNPVLAAKPDLAGARDTTGRLIMPALQLQALLSGKLSEQDRARLQSSLAARLLDYGDPVLPSSQRLFLAQEFKKIEPTFVLPTFVPEQIAVELLQMPLPPMSPGVLTPARGMQDGWLLLSRDHSRVAYFHTNQIRHKLSDIAHQHLSGHGLNVRIVPAGEERPSNYVTHASAGKSLPGWEVEVYRTPDAEREAGRQRTQRFIAIGAAVVALIGLVGYLSVRRYITISRTTELRHDFLSTVSHELKTPLTSIRLLVETLGAGQWANPERTKQYTEVMQREITRLSHLVESFLTYTRLERGKLKFEFAETDPAQIADHAVAIIGARFRGNCDFIVDVAPDLPLLNADSDTLITAVLNLLDNAYKYSPDKKRITFRVYAYDKSVYFSVGDNGIGLSPADCRRVLQRYYRVDSEATRGIGGAGLGLSITKNVAEAHGGELSVKSELGKGSCFTIRVPVHNPEKS